MSVECQEISQELLGIWPRRSFGFKFMLISNVQVMRRTCVHAHAPAPFNDGLALVPLLVAVNLLPFVDEHPIKPTGVDSRSVADHDEWNGAPP